VRGREGSDKGKGEGGTELPTHACTHQSRWEREKKMGASADRSGTHSHACTARTHLNRRTQLTS